MRKSFVPAVFALTLTAAVILIILCFTASACISANKDFKDAERYRNYTDKYYAAETTAAEIISKYSGASDAGNTSLTSGQSGKSIYSSPQGSIRVFRADSSLSFAVPIDSRRQLAVIVNASGSDINILKWSVENR